jgi:DNA-binding transcriptional ArsR family regulator
LPLPTDPDQLRRVAAAFGALAHPTRLQILQELRDGGALSPRQLTDRLTPPVGLANLAHHTRELASRGVLKPAGTRPARGAVEHFYRLSPHGHELIEFVDRVMAQASRDGRGEGPSS